MICYNTWESIKCTIQSLLFFIVMKTVSWLLGRIASHPGFPKGLQAETDHGLLWEVCSCHIDHFVCISTSSSYIPRWRVPHAGLSRVQARGEQILFQARSTHLPVHWVLFLPCLSHSNEVQEDHACSKEHYIRSNMLRSKGFYQDYP